MNSNKETVVPSVPQTKIVPTFGKQKNLKKNDKKPVTKAKKFVAPAKKSSNVDGNPTNKEPTQCLQPTLKTNVANLNQVEPNPIQDFESLNTPLQFLQNMNTGNMRIDMPQTPQYSNNAHTYPNELTTLDDSLNIGSLDLFNLHQSLEKVDNTLEDISNTLSHETYQKDSQENSLIINKKVSLPQKIKSNILSSIISSSLNILDDEDIIPTENLPLEAHSDQSSVKNLSQTQNQSICSVTSLSKTYKNLDCNSFQNGGYKIPDGHDFLELFKNHDCEKVKPFAMSTEYGDIGFNMKYSDYMKDFGLIDDLTEEEKVTKRKIINMYPNENSILMKKLPKENLQE